MQSCARLLLSKIFFVTATEARVFIRCEADAFGCRHVNDKEFMSERGFVLSAASRSHPSSVEFLL